MIDRRLLAAATLVVGALVAQAGLASPAHAAGPRYASPTGTSAQNCLTAATACNIEKAFSGSTSSNDEIILAAGTYMTATVLSRTQSGVNVHGTPGQPRPLLVSTASMALSLSGTGSKVSDLVIRHEGSQYALNLFAKATSVQRVDVRTTSDNAVACSPGITGLIRDSLCVATGANGIALDNSYGGDSGGTLTVRNVTAVATGAGSYGIRADSLANASNLVVNLRNVIASGVAADLRATEDPTNSESTIAALNSNYDTAFVSGGGAATGAGTSTNQKTAPVFADASFHQGPGSPTINAGAVDTSTGTADIDGEPRPYQGAMDIGADEFYPDVTPPETILVKAPKARTHKRRAVFAFTASEPSSFLCKLDKKPQAPCTSPYKKRLKRFGKHTMTITAVDASGNVDPTPVVHTWKLKKKRRHR